MPPLIAEITGLLGWDEARRHRALVVNGLDVVDTLVAVVLSVV